VEAAQDPDVHDVIARLRDADSLDPAELRELNPSLLILEALAVRESPPFGTDAIAELRAANKRLLDSAGDATAAALADDDFHRRLIANCGNQRVLDAVDPVRRAMLGYERVHMLSPARLARSVDEHEAIIRALERGDHSGAADLLRENFATGMPEVEAELRNHGGVGPRGRAPAPRLARLRTAMTFRGDRRHTDMTNTTAPQLDRTSFTASVERHRRELQVHCYRMLGSFEESEDIVQETFLRAWRRRETYAGRSSLRAWLYKIATNACLDALDKRPRTVSPSGEVLWLQPFPDELLDEVAGEGDDPEAAVVSKETIELAYLVAIQRLVPLQRAVLILRDVLSCTARETADVLETSVPAVNSALQRARAAMKEHLPEPRTEWASGVDATAAERELLGRYVEYSQNPDPHALKQVLSDDVRFSMPPQPGLWEGRDEVLDAWVEGGFGTESFGSLRCVVTRANRQPAVACYVRSPGDAAYTPLAIDVLRIADGAVADIVTFDGSVFGWFGLPETL
jgi:RNA polymerase sigma-70 factor (TIGR02960 family)